jgi:phenylacetate-CoA ligase
MTAGFANRAALQAEQLRQLRSLLKTLLPANPFYAAKLRDSGLAADVASLEEFCRRCPFTTKAEIAADQHAHPPFGTNLTFPVEAYTRCHQTSGTSGAPLRWLDTPESWAWMIGNWEQVHRAGGVTKADRIFFAFSFGPFLGFWTAFESAQRIGSLVFSGGGMSSAARVRAILDLRATVVCCTPTYAIHLAEVAAQEKLDLATSAVRLLSVAGEPGGSIPAVRERLQQLWPGARIHDHHGMTEVGPVSFEDPTIPCSLRVIESSYLAEVMDPQTLQPVADGAVGELVLTTLGRTGSPLLRYRTGDLVKPRVADDGEFLLLEGGILGRADDMIVVRGVNVYPSAVDEIVRGLAGIAEYRVRVLNAAALAELRVEIEPQTGHDGKMLAATLERRFSTALALRVPVAAVAAGALPRFEMKARRWVRE